MPTWKKLGYDEDVAAASSAASAANSAASVADSKAVSAGGLAGSPLVSHAASHMNGGVDELTLDDFGEPTNPVNFFHQQAQNLVIHTTANTATLSSLNVSAAIGKVAYVTAESGIYVCTVSA